MMTENYGLTSTTRNDDYDVYFCFPRVVYGIDFSEIEDNAIRKGCNEEGHLS